jgi:hypothetical protein
VRNHIFNYASSLEKGVPLNKRLLLSALLLAAFPATSHAIEPGAPEALAGTPFPNKDFALQGGPTIGQNVEPANGALHKAIFGDSLDSARIHVGGWVVLGWNQSSSNKTNLPMGYTVYPNRMDLNEIELRAIRAPDTVQKDHVDWGFKVDALYGVDYYMFLSKGLFSKQQFTGNPSVLGNNNQYGYDIPQLYADLYVPGIAQGSNFRLGRILSNPTVYMKRSYLFTHTVFDNNIGDTQTGLINTTKLTDNVTVQLGAVNTADVSIFSSTDKKLSGFGAIQWTSTPRDDSVYLEAYNVNSGNFAYHNWQTFYFIWTHKFNDKLFSRMQNAYFYEKNVPVGSALGEIPSGTYDSSKKSAKATGFSFQDLIGYSFTNSDYAAFRAEYTGDSEGSLTGTAAYYVTYTIGWGHNFNSWLAGTLEARSDHSYKNLAYDNGNSNHLALWAASLTANF